MVAIDRDYHLSQVKQKWGLLCVYLDDDWYAAHGRQEIALTLRRVADEYERRSDGVCERCGAAGRLRGGTGIATLCTPCGAAENETVRGAARIRRLRQMMEEQR